MRNIDRYLKQVMLNSGEINILLNTNKKDLLGGSADQLTNEELLAAIIAEQSYSNNPLDKIDGYDLVENTNDYKIYKKDDNLIIGFAGTRLNPNLSSLYDITNDYMLTRGIEDKSIRFNRSLKLVKDLLKQNFNITITGHSLGGSIVLYVSSILDNVIGYAFNPGAGLNISKCFFKCKNLNIYLTKDLLSRFAGILGTTSDANIKYIKPIQEGLKSHYIKNFTN